MPRKKMGIKSDERMNPELREEIQGLRGGMLGQAEKNPIPERFTSESDPDSPAVWITDNTTGRKSRVSLYALGNVRQTLNDLFGDA